MRSRAWVLVGVVALASVLLDLQWTHPLQWDEVEFFRATRWIAEGRVPFRDFWEHHLPLQWYVFAPAAALLSDGPGVTSVLALRWVQLALWIALFAILGRADVPSARAGGTPALLLLASPLFARTAIEYRLDALGSVCYIAALALAVLRPRSRGAWIAAGALMSAGVLANMRMMPLAIATGALLLFFDGEERRWRWNATALWMLPGIAMMALAFAAWLFASGAYPGFVEAMRYNVDSNRLLTREAHTLLPVLLLPFTTFDAAAIALWLGAICGSVLALREIRRPGLLQLFALLAIVSVVIVTQLGVHYVYHLQLPLLLMAPLAASLITNERIERIALIALAVIAAVNLARHIDPPIGAAMRYQDTVMREVDRRTLPNERVWDGVGHALRREPAYQYWFLPSGVRMLVPRGMLRPPYGAAEMIAAPPAAIVNSYRVHLWLSQFPDAGAYATHHYIPLYRDLWLPGLSAAVGPGKSAEWIAPRAGRYRLYASDLLLKHPWFQQPLNYAIYAGPDAPIFTVPLRELPPSRATLTIDGASVTGTTFALRKGARVRLQSPWSTPMGVMIIPDDLTEIFITPAAGGM